MDDQIEEYRKKMRAAFEATHVQIAPPVPPPVPSSSEAKTTTAEEAEKADFEFALEVQKQLIQEQYDESVAAAIQRQEQTEAELSRARYEPIRPWYADYYGDRQTHREPDGRDIDDLDERFARELQFGEHERGEEEHSPAGSDPGSEDERDPGGDSYEELLALGEMIGPAVPRGAPQSAIDALPIIEFAGKGQPKSCSICLEDFVVGESLRVLPCLHCFHRACGDRALQEQKTCPVCRSGI